MKFLFLWWLSYLLLAALTFAENECSTTKPCDLGCCSKFGSCGFGPSFCGAGNCTSGCDAKAECGQYAPENKRLCPLNVCCSQYGFCGTTPEFCGEGCQNGCGKVQEPRCNGSSSSKRVIGYYESWASERPCDKWLPEDIDPFAWTHIYYSFVLIDSSHRVASMNSYDPEFYRRVTDLKKQNQALKVFIAVGGWSAGGKIFSDMARTADGRRAFIDSLISLMRSFSFDGADIDWEYPFAPDRGGFDEDFVNFVTLMKELRATCGARYGLSLTLPSSYWYLKGFDVAKLQNHIDWFQFMSYDIHGTWDANSRWTRALVTPHTNLTEISDGLDLLWRNGVHPSKVVLGLGFYGRSFTLRDISCKTPGCPFSNGAHAGECTTTPGVLSNAEIQRLITSKSLKPVLDREAGVKWVSWDSNQWVSYDDAGTFKMKIDYANSHCLGGIMVWALDLEDKTIRESSRYLITNKLNLPPGIGSDELAFHQTLAAAAISAENYGLAVYWTTCQQRIHLRCAPGFTILTYGQGKIYDADIKHFKRDSCERLGAGLTRALCAPENLIGDCMWFGKGKSCDAKCGKGYWELAKNSHIGGEKTACQHGKFAKYCCKNLHTYNLDHCYDARYGIAKFLSGGKANYNREVVQRGYDYFQPHPCSDEFLGLPLRDERSGWHSVDVAGHFEAQGESTVWQPAGSLLPPTNQGAQPQTTRLLRDQTVTITTRIFFDRSATSTCDGSQTVQPCHHYSSVCHREPGLRTLMCPEFMPWGARSAPALWNSQHDGAWSESWIPGAFGCERDEFPFFRFVGNTRGSWIRLLKGNDNRRAGQIPNRACDPSWITSSGPTRMGPVHQVNGRFITTIYRTDVVSRKFLVLKFTNCDLPDFGISSNLCNPIVLTYDPGFALLVNDPWYKLQPNKRHRSLDYRFPPRAELTRGKTPLTRRDYLPEEFIVDLGNSSRRATEKELYERYSIVRCGEDDCAAKAQALGLSYTLPPIARETTVASAQLLHITDSPSVSGIDTDHVSTYTRVAPTLALSPAMVQTSATPVATGATTSPFSDNEHSTRHLRFHRGVPP